MNILRFFAHGFLVLGALFVLACSDNSGGKAELAALQASYYSALATNSALSSAVATDATKLANGAAYRNCVTNATSDAARSSCSQIAF
jgi:hypothetical protein